MAYSYDLTELVINDIDETLNYIINKLYNKKAARDLLEEIEKTIANICMFPNSYPDCKYYFIRDESVRHAVINNYILVYKICENKIVFIRFKHSKQDKLL